MTRVRRPFLTAAGIALGVYLLTDVLRVWLPSIITVFGQAASTPAELMGGFALLWFVGAFAVVPLLRPLGPRGVAVAAAAALTAARLALIATDGGQLQLYVASAGLLAGLVWLAATAVSGAEPMPGLVLGLVLGTVAHAATGTFDLAWRGGAAAWAVAATAGVAFVCLAVPAAGPGGGSAASWFVAGPALALWTMVAGSPALASTAVSFALGEESGIAGPGPGGVLPVAVVLAVSVGLLAAAALLPRPRPVTVLAGAAVLAGGAALFGWSWGSRLPEAMVATALGLGLLLNATALRGKARGPAADDGPAREAGEAAGRRDGEPARWPGDAAESRAMEPDPVRPRGGDPAGSAPRTWNAATAEGDRPAWDAGTAAGGRAGWDRGTAGGGLPGWNEAVGSGASAGDAGSGRGAVAGAGGDGAGNAGNAGTARNGGAPEGRSGAGTRGGSPTAGRGFAAVTGMTAMAVATVLYYASYDIGYPNDWVPLAVAVLVIVVAGRPPYPRVATDRAWAWAAVPMAVFATLLAGMAMPRNPGGEATPAGEPGAIRVVAYNIRMGFGLDGRFDLDGLVTAIAGQRPDVVLLSEVDRAWLLNGGHDTLALIADRLDMPYRFAPAADAVWGDAVLTRLPVVYTATTRLSSVGAPTGAQALGVVVDAAGREIAVVSTHLQPPPGAAGPVTQARELATFALGFAAGRPLVVGGDLNTQPGEPAFTELTNAGLVDGFAAIRPLPTAPADHPDEQIDHILVSPEIVVTDVAAPRTESSDHLPVAATVTVP